MTASTTFGPPSYNVRWAVARGRAGLWFKYGFLVLAAIFCLFPLVWTLVSAFKPGQTLLSAPFSFSFAQATLGNFKGLFETIPIWRGFLNTAIVVVARAAGSHSCLPLWLGTGLPSLTFR